MGTTYSTDRDDRRAARLARLHAARATQPRMVAVEVAASDVRVGDWLERIPAQGGARGLRVETTVTLVDVTHDEWGQRVQGRRRMVPVEGRRFHFRDDGKLGQVHATCPAEFRVIVRRPQP